MNLIKIYDMYIFMKHIVLTTIFLIWPLLLSAEIYFYTDKEGVRHFTNTPSSGDYEVFRATRQPRFHFSPTRYDHLIRKASKLHGIDFELLKAVIRAESSFNPRAVSKAGALGLMQIMPFNLKRLKIKDPFNPWQNIMGGTAYLKYLLKRFSGNLPFALAGYNAGPLRVEKHKGIPPIRETRNYVRKVMKFYSYYQK